METVALTGADVAAAGTPESSSPSMKSPALPPDSPAASEPPDSDATVIVPVDDATEILQTPVMPPLDKPSTPAPSDMPPPRPLSVGGPLTEALGEYEVAAENRSQNAPAGELPPGFGLPGAAPSPGTGAGRAPEEVQSPAPPPQRSVPAPEPAASVPQRPAPGGTPSPVAEFDVAQLGGERSQSPAPVPTSPEPVVDSAPASTSEEPPAAL